MPGNPVPTLFIFSFARISSSSQPTATSTINPTVKDCSAASSSVGAQGDVTLRGLPGAVHSWIRTIPTMIQKTWTRCLPAECFGSFYTTRPASSQCTSPDQPQSKIIPSPMSFLVPLCSTYSYGPPDSSASAALQSASYVKQEVNPEECGPL